MHQRAWHGSLFQCLDGSLNGPILMGRAGSRRLYYVPGLSKQVKGFLTATKFPFKIHPNIFEIDHRSGALGVKSFVEPIDARSL